MENEGENYIKKHNWQETIAHTNKTVLFATISVKII